MSRKANPTLIGAFVLGALALAVVTTLLLAAAAGSAERRQHIMYFEGAAQGLQVGAPWYSSASRSHRQADPARPRPAEPPLLVPVMIELEPHVVRTARRRAHRPARFAPTVRQLVDRGLPRGCGCRACSPASSNVDLDSTPNKPAVFCRTRSRAQRNPDHPHGRARADDQARKLPHGQVPRRRCGHQCLVNQLMSGASDAGAAAAARCELAATSSPLPPASTRRADPS